MFANGPGDLGSIPDRVIPKTQKWYFRLPFLTLNIIRQGSRVRWSNPGKGVAPSPTPWYSSYQKGSLLVTFDKGPNFTFYYIIQTIVLILVVIVTTFWSLYLQTFFRLPIASCEDSKLSDKIKDSVRNSLKFSHYNKTHLKMAEEYSGRNVQIKTIKMRRIVQIVK